MNKLSILTILISSLCLVSCGPDKEPEKKVVQEKQETTDNKQENVILDPAMKALNKAKSVEQTILDAEARRKKEIDEQEKESSDDETN
ncbi:MAG: hypothetical protein ACI9IA_000706 [Enterobacterales bacterium]|jgi:hypothetical protein